jgi:hypothetical protein
LRPLEGAGFKEAGAYALKNGRHAGVGSNLADKVHRFPFVEAVRLPATAPGRWFGASEAANAQQRHETENEKAAEQEKREEEKEEDEEDRAYEPFVSADGSVGYMFESAGIPARIRADTRGRAKVRNSQRKALSSLGLARSLAFARLARSQARFLTLWRLLKKNGAAGRARPLL